MWKSATTWATAVHPYYNYPPCLLLSYYTVLPVFSITRGKPNKYQFSLRWTGFINPVHASHVHLLFAEGQEQLLPKIIFLKGQQLKKDRGTDSAQLLLCTSLISHDMNISWAVTRWAVAGPGKKSASTGLWLCYVPVGSDWMREKWERGRGISYTP